MVKRVSLNLDLELVAVARSVLKTHGTADTIHRALEEVIRGQKLRELAQQHFDDLSPDALAQLRSQS